MQGMRMAAARCSVSCHVGGCRGSAGLHSSLHLAAAEESSHAWSWGWRGGQREVRFTKSYSVHIGTSCRTVLRTPDKTCTDSVHYVSCDF
jgi:hypothetical protein